MNRARSRSRSPVRRDRGNERRRGWLYLGLINHVFHLVVANCIVSLWFWTISSVALGGFRCIPRIFREAAS